MTQSVKLSLKDILHIVIFVEGEAETNGHNETKIINNAKEILSDIDEMGTYSEIETYEEKLAARVKGMEDDTVKDIVTKALKIIKKVPRVKFKREDVYENWKEEREDLIYEVFDKYIEE